MYWVDYGGQNLEGFDFIGTDDLQVPVSEVEDVTATVEDLERRCGRFARIKLFRDDEKESVPA